MSDERDPNRPTALNSIDPPRNFTISTEDRVRALTIGPPAYAVRKRKIEDREVEMLDALVELHDALAAKGLTAHAIKAAVEAKASTFDLAKLNKLVETHNRYYPIEANLRIDPRTGGYLIYAGQAWSPEPLWTVERLLALYAKSIAERG